MAKQNGNGGKRSDGAKNGANGKHDGEDHRLHPDTKTSIWGISFLCVAVVLALAGFSKAGPAGDGSRSSPR